jgi:hypothetical protein
MDRQSMVGFFSTNPLATGTIRASTMIAVKEAIFSLAS